MGGLSGLFLSNGAWQTFPSGFCWKCCLVEIVSLHRHYSFDANIPIRYNLTSFWFIRILLALSLGVRNSLSRMGSRITHY